MHVFRIRNRNHLLVCGQYTPSYVSMEWWVFPGNTYCLDFLSLIVELQILVIIFLVTHLPLMMYVPLFTYKPLV